MRYQPISTFVPEYGKEALLYGLDDKGQPIKAVATWCKAAVLNYGPRGGEGWIDGWQLQAVGAHATDYNLDFEPSHWAELPSETEIAQALQGFSRTSVR